MKLSRVFESVRHRFGRLNARDRRALVLGAWLLVPSLAYVWVVKPVVADFSEVRERLTSERDLLIRERTLLATASELPIHLAHADTMLAQAQTRLFTGPDPVAAAAALARYVTERATQHHVLVQGSETREVEELDQGMLRLVVEVRAIGDLAGLTGWLADLEGGPRLVDVTDLRVTPANRLGAEEDEDEEVLGVVLRASGFTVTPIADSTTIALGGRP